MAWADRKELFPARYGVIITVVDLKQAEDESVKKKSVSSNAAELPQLFTESTMYILIGLMHGVAAKNVANVPHSKVWITFVRSGCSQGGYVPTMSNVDLEH